MKGENTNFKNHRLPWQIRHLQSREIRCYNVDRDQYYLNPKTIENKEKREFDNKNRKLFRLRARELAKSILSSGNKEILQDEMLLVKRIAIQLEEERIFRTLAVLDRKSRNND